MFSYTRRQTTASLSSYEAELIASTAAIAESIFLKKLMQSLTSGPVEIMARLDSSSARSLLQKAGVSRVRHLDVRLLWAQRLDHGEVDHQRAASTAENSSDLATKALTSERIRHLLGYVGMFNGDGEIRLLKSSNKVARIQRVNQVSANAMAQMRKQPRLMEQLE